MLKMISKLQNVNDHLQKQQLHRKVSNDGLFCFGLFWPLLAYEMKGKAVLIINFTGYVEELGCAVSLPSFVNEFEMFVVCRLDQTFEML